MKSLKSSSIYQWYLSKEKELRLPPFEKEGFDTITVYAGEVFCRVEGCGSMTRYSSTNNLRHHLKDKHSELSTIKQVGAPSIMEVSKAKVFYTTLKEQFDHDFRQLVPRKGNRQINITETRRIIREKGGNIPCDTCEIAGLQKECGLFDQNDNCDHELFFFFDKNEVEDENDRKG